MSIKKDAYYFPHFSNARNDRKIKRLRKELHTEGYGIYFMILEVLRDQDGFIYPMSDLDILADDLGTSEQKVRTVICNYDLFLVFEIEGKQHFSSPKFNEYLEPYLQKSQRAREAANKRWSDNQRVSNANAYANALPEHSKSNADQNASKVKNSKEEYSIGENPPDVSPDTVQPAKPEKKKFVAPTIQMVISYFVENGYAEEAAKKAFAYYEVNNWRDSRNKPIINWKQKMHGVWFKDENKPKPNQSQPITGAPNAFVPGKMVL